MTSVKSGVLFCCVSILLTGCFAQEQSASNHKKGFVKSLLKDCVTSYSLTCLKLDMASWLDRLDKKSEYSILPGVDLVRDPTKAPIQENDEINEIAREFPEDPYARLDAYLVKKAKNFLSIHSLKVNLGKGVVEGRGKSKGGGGMGIIFAMGALMKGMMLAKALAVITAIAGKALMLAIVSMIVSAILGSKHHHHHERSLGGTEDAFSTFKRVFMENLQENLELPAGLQPDYKPA